MYYMYKYYIAKCWLITFLQIQDFFCLMQFQVAPIALGTAILKILSPQSITIKIHFTDKIK